MKSERKEWYDNYRTILGIERISCRIEFMQPQSEFEHYSERFMNDWLEGFYQGFLATRRLYLEK